MQAWALLIVHYILFVVCPAFISRRFENKSKNYFVLLDIRQIALESSLTQVIWPLTRKNLTLLHSKNKGTDQPVYLHSLISAFVFTH